MLLFFKDFFATILGIICGISIICSTLFIGMQATGSKNVTEFIGQGVTSVANAVNNAD